MSKFGMSLDGRVVWISSPTSSKRIELPEKLEILTSDLDFSNFGFPDKGSEIEICCESIASSGKMMRAAAVYIFFGMVSSNYKCSFKFSKMDKKALPEFEGRSVGEKASKFFLKKITG